MMNEHDDTASSMPVSILVIPEELAGEVRAYAEQLADEQSAEVSGFAAGLPNLGSMGSILGRPSIGRATGAFSGTGCVISKAIHADDVNCADDD